MLGVYERYLTPFGFDGPTFMGYLSTEILPRFDEIKMNKHKKLDFTVDIDVGESISHWFAQIQKGLPYDLTMDPDEKIGTCDHLVQHLADECDMMRDEPEVPGLSDQYTTRFSLLYIFEAADRMIKDYFDHQYIPDPVFRSLALICGELTDALEDSDNLVLDIWGKVKGHLKCQQAPEFELTAGWYYRHPNTLFRCFAYTNAIRDVTVVMTFIDVFMNLTLAFVAPPHENGIYDSATLDNMIDAYDHALQYIRDMIESYGEVFHISFFIISMKYIYVRQLTYVENRKAAGIMDADAAKLITDHIKEMLVKLDRYSDFWRDMTDNEIWAEASESSSSSRSHDGKAVLNHSLSSSSYSSSRFKKHQ